MYGPAIPSDLPAIEAATWAVLWCIARVARLRRCAVCQKYACVLGAEVSRARFEGGTETSVLQECTKPRFVTPVFQRPVSYLVLSSTSFFPQFSLSSAHICPSSRTLTVLVLFLYVVLSTHPTALVHHATPRDS